MKSVMKKFIYLLAACAVASMAQAQTWTKLNLPETGKAITDLYEDASGNLFALTQQGLFKSTDKAANWSLVDRNLKGVQVMTVAPNGDIWVDETSATLKYDGTKTTQNQWYRWATNNTTANMVSLSDGKLLYTYVDAIKRKQKYFTSTDNGANFTENTAITNILWKGVLQSQLMVKKNDDVFYLGSDKNLYKSTDKGITYTAMGSAITHTGRENGICLDKEKGHFYALWGSGNATDIRKSTDDGATWTKLNSSSIYGAVGVVANKDIVIIHGSWMFMYSNDGGATWSDKKGMFESGKFPEKVIVASDGKVYATNIAGNAIMELDMTAGTKALKTKGLDYASAKGLSYNGARLAACLSGYAHFTNDNGATWTQLKGPGAIAGNTYVAKSGKVYTASQASGTWAGVHVNDANDSMVAVSADSDQVWNMQSMFEDDKGNLYCLSNLYGLYKSSDGTNFTKMTNAPYDNLGDMTMWFSNSNKRIYAIMGAPEEIHYSDDYGVTWTKGTTLTTLVRTHFKGEGAMWVYAWSTTPSETGFYYSSDLTSWTGPFQTTTSFDSRWSEPEQANLGKLFTTRSDNAGTGFTVLSSSDTGKTWTPFASGLDTVMGFAFNGSQSLGVPYNQLITAYDKLYLGTNGSIYTANQAAGPMKVETLKNSSLKIYPNPVNYTLHLGLKATDIVSVSIYTIQGRAILNVKDAKNSIDVSKLNAGVYVIAVRTKTGVESAQFLKL
jgi:hypothetical protein